MAQGEEVGAARWDVEGNGGERGRALGWRPCFVRSLGVKLGACFVVVGKAEICGWHRGKIRQGNGMDG